MFFVLVEHLFWRLRFTVLEATKVRRPISAPAPLRAAVDFLRSHNLPDHGRTPSKRNEMKTKILSEKWTGENENENESGTETQAFDFDANCEAP